MDAQAVIEADGLTRRFGGRTAVQGLSLAVQRGEVFGLLGSDGAGKTTTLQMLAAILDPGAGRATVLGFDTVRQAAAITARIGYMSQTFSLYGRLTVEENLDFFAELHRVPEAEKRARKAQLLDFARLGAHRERTARYLSGGMQKKLALCCALIHQPKLLLLDEPTTGVDPVSRREFWNILYRALTGGTTIVVSTPYMDEAERCTRVALLHDGRLIACNAPGRLRAEMPGIMLEIEAYPQRQALAILRQALPEARPYVFGERIHLYWPREEGAAAVRSLLEQGRVTVEQVRPVTPSLEDVFVTRLAESVEAIPALPPSGPAEKPAGLAVEAVDLSVRFGAFTAVDRVSFSVRHGEIFGFLGPNGSGKTTVIRMLCGLLAPTSGRAIVAGHELGKEPQAVKSRIGYMSQRFSLYEDMTVAENIAFFAGAYGVPNAALPACRERALRHAPSCTGRRCCSWTSPPPASIPYPGGASGS
jgi:ABC-2 type transport system ATP-binding protein